MDRLDAILARLDAAFKESDHPRDGDGKFASRSSKLSSTEKSHLASYASDDFLRLNGELRSGKATDPAVKHIDNAIEKSGPLKVDRVYRGMSRDAAKKLFHDGEIKRGAVISDPAYLSTSKSENEASARAIGGVVFKIDINAGSKGLDLGDINQNKSEQEVLLPRNAELLVIGVIAPKNVGDPVIVRLAY